LSINFDNGNKEVRAALEAEQGKREPKAPKSTGKVEKVKAVKATAKKAVKPTLESIKAKAKVPATAKSKAEVQAVLDAAEDAPF
jgi:hypothetical protein